MWRNIMYAIPIQNMLCASCSKCSTVFRLLDIIKKKFALFNSEFCPVLGRAIIFYIHFKYDNPPFAFATLQRFPVLFKGTRHVLIIKNGAVNKYSQPTYCVIS